MTFRDPVTAEERRRRWRFLPEESDHLTTLASCVGGVQVTRVASRPAGVTRQLTPDLGDLSATSVPQTEQQTGAEVTFRVALEDRNDEVPIFYDTDRVTVTENSPPGTYVTVTTAVDADGTPPNNKV